jgi:lysine-arginine-ornithine-binding protein
MRLRPKRSPCAPPGSCSNLTRMKALFIAFTTYLFCCVPSSYSEIPSTIKIGTNPTYAPFESKASNGSVVGFEIDLGNLLCEKMGVKPEWIQMDFDGLIPALQARKIDVIMSSIVNNEKRKRQIAFSTKIFKSPIRLVAKTGSPISPDSLSGKSIGVEQGTTSEMYAKGKFFQKGAKVISFSTQDQAYTDMKSGRIDAVLVDEVQAQIGFLKSPDAQGCSFAGPEIEDPVLTGNGASVAFRKNNTELLDAFNKAIDEVRKDGSYDRLAKKYFDFDIYGK